MHICSISVRFPPFPHRVENGENPEHTGISHSFHRVFHRACECSCLYIDMHMHDSAESVSVFMRNACMFMRGGEDTVCADGKNPQNV